MSSRPKLHPRSQHREKVVDRPPIQTAVLTKGHVCWCTCGMCRGRISTILLRYERRRARDRAREAEREEAKKRPLVEPSAAC